MKQTSLRVEQTDEGFLMYFDDAKEPSYSGLSVDALSNAILEHLRQTFNAEEGA